MEVNDNLSSNLYVEYSQSTDGSIYTARSLTNSWNDSSGNQYPPGLTFTKFVNGSIEWVRTVNTTTPLNYQVGYYYTRYQYSEMFSDEYGVTLLGRTSANKFHSSSKTVQTYGTSSYIISFDSSGNLNNMEVNDNLSSNLNVEYSQSTDGSIYTARYVSNSWNDSSGNQYPSGISFTKFVNGSIDWVRTINSTISNESLCWLLFPGVSIFRRYFSDRYSVTLLGRNDANNLTMGQTQSEHMVHQATLFHFDSISNLNNMEVNDNLSSNLNVEYSQSTDGSIYTARYVSNSWNDSSGNQYPSGISFTKFVNGSIDWVRTINSTIS